MTSVEWCLKFTFIVPIMWPMCDTSQIGDAVSRRLNVDIADVVMGAKEFEVRK